MKLNIVNRIKREHSLDYALRVGIGASVAIYIAFAFKLESAPSAGIITLLTILSTKAQTWRLSVDRVITFMATIFLAWIAMFLTNYTWLAFGVVLTILTFGLVLTKLQATLSVNTVILTHIMGHADMTWALVFNEFGLLMIGIVIAIIINQFQNYNGQRKNLIAGVNDIEGDFKIIFDNLKKYVKNHDLEGVNVWDQVVALEGKIHSYQNLAHQYQENNRMDDDDEYFVNYFEMRAQQINILHNLHYELKKIRKSSEESEQVASYLDVIGTYFTYIREPKIQMAKLNEFMTKLENAPIPTSQEEFSIKSRMYHILMDLEDFVVLKKRFIKNNKIVGEKKLD